MHEGNEVGLFLVVHFERAAGIEHDRVEVVQVLRVVLQFLLRQRFGVRAEDRVPQSGLAAQPLDRHHRVGDCFVPIAFFLTDDQQLLSGHAGRGALGREHRTDDRGECHDQCETSELHAHSPTGRFKTADRVSRLQPDRTGFVSVSTNVNLLVPAVCRPTAHG